MLTHFNITNRIEWNYMNEWSIKLDPLLIGNIKYVTFKGYYFWIMRESGSCVDHKVDCELIN